MEREHLAALGKGLLVAILIAQSLGLLLVLRGERENPGPQQPISPPQTREPQRDSERTANDNPPEAQKEQRGDGGSHEFPRRYVSSAGGYSLRYPRGWRLEVSDSVTELTSPDGAAKVSFGVGPAGDLSASARTILGALEREYGDVIVTETSRTRVNGLRARLAEGRATNDGGLRLWFRALSLEEDSSNFVALCFEKSGGTNSLRRIATEIMGTLRASSEGAGSLSMVHGRRNGGGP